MKHKQLRIRGYRLYEQHQNGDYPDITNGWLTMKIQAHKFEGIVDALDPRSQCQSSTRYKAFLQVHELVQCRQINEGKDFEHLQHLH